MFILYLFTQGYRKNIIIGIIRCPDLVDICNGLSPEQIRVLLEFPLGWSRGFELGSKSFESQPLIHEPDPLLCSLEMTGSQHVMAQFPVSIGGMSLPCVQYRSGKREFTIFLRIQLPLALFPHGLFLMGLPSIITGTVYLQQPALVGDGQPDAGCLELEGDFLVHELVQRQSFMFNFFI